MRNSRSVAYILVRDLGDRRFPAAMITLFSGIIFGILVNMLHRRDRRVAEAGPPAGEGLIAMGQYLPVLAMIVLAVLFGVLAAWSLRCSLPVGPPPRSRRPTSRASSPPRAAGTVPGALFLVAMSFIVFDIEIIFLYPWAVIYRNLGWQGSSRSPCSRCR